MNTIANTGLIICVSGDGPRYDLHFHYARSRFTRTAVEAIVKAAIAQAHGQARQAVENDIAEFPSVQDLIESCLSKIGIESVKPMVSPVWDDQTLAAEGHQGAVAQALIAQGYSDLAERLLDGTDLDAGGPAAAMPSPN